MSVTDDSNFSEGFSDQNKSGDDYVYDAFGNKIVDKNKKIESIRYNHLHQPTEIVTQNGVVVYDYTSSGSKVKKTINTPANGAHETEYLFGFQYENGMLQFFPHSEGYVTPKGNNSYLCVYQHRDYQGHVRLSYADIDSNGSISPETELLKVSHYYPFGLKHSGYGHIDNQHGNALAERYNYLNRELESRIGLHHIETDYRHYEPSLGRFSGIDLLSEQMYEQTPYHYGYNNPVYWKDPSGLLSEDLIKNIWNNSPQGQTTLWINKEGYFQRDLGEFVFNVYYTGETEVSELLPLLEVEGRRGGSGYINLPSHFGWLVQAHVYKHSAYYQYLREAMRNAQLDSFQSDLTKVGAFPVVGDAVDILNGFISLYRGNYVDAVVNFASALPVGGTAVGGAKLAVKTIGSGVQYSVAFEMKLASSSYPGVYRGAHFLEANKALSATMAADARFASSMSQLGINIPRSPAGSILT